MVDRYMALFVGGIVAFIFLLWIIGFLIANDFSIPTSSINKYKNVLVVFPHADDEALTASGLIHTLSQQGAKVTLVILTKGERGTSDGSLNLSLKGIRTKEAQQAATILGVSQLIQEDFGDGQLQKKKQRVAEYVDQLFNSIKPDLVITYDLSGLYGHPDHIACSEVITELIKKKYTHTELWYATYPRKVLSMIHLPEHMANDPKFKGKRTTPSIKIFVGSEVLLKIQTVYAYKSQINSFIDGLPFKFIPPWFYYTMEIFEYFNKAN